MVPLVPTEKMANPDQLDLPASLELHHQCRHSRLAAARNAHLAHLAHLDLLDHLEPTASLDQLATPARKANPVATEKPDHPVQLDSLAPLAKMERPVLLEKMDLLAPRDRMDHLARPDPLDQRERTAQMVHQATAVHPADLDLLESPDRKEAPDHPVKPANLALRDHPATTPSTARARAARSSTRSRRPKRHQPSLSSHHETTTEFSFSTDNTLTLCIVITMVLVNSKSAISDSFVN